MTTKTLDKIRTAMGGGNSLFVSDIAILSGLSKTTIRRGLKILLDNDQAKSTQVGTWNGLPVCEYSLTMSIGDNQHEVA